jgi:hypothetical protein
LTCRLATRMVETQRLLMAFECVSFFNHFKTASVFHGFASLLFLDLSADFC